MPAEWEPHLACYLVWPHNRDTWPGKFEVIPPIYAEMVATIARFEPVRLLVNDASADRRSARDDSRRRRRSETEAPGPLLPIDMFHLPTNDSWVRDHGPIFVNRLATPRPTARTDRARLALQFVGRKVRRLRSRRRRPAKARRALRLRSDRARHRARRRLDRRQRRRLPAHHRIVPAQPESQSHAEPRRHRRVPADLSRRDATCCGWATASPATTPTATSTTSRASSPPTPSSR